MLALWSFVLWKNLSVLLAVDIYHASLWFGKYPPLAMSTSVKSC